MMDDPTYALEAHLLAQIRAIQQDAQARAAPLVAELDRLRALRFLPPPVLPLRGNAGGS